MGRVQILEKSVADRIAAGEVVERPASVIKELVENSLDAGSTRVTVELQSGGIQKMRVIDDGCGMSAADARLSLERFATSKIRHMEDLDELQSLGFRGEALPSIAAVSRLEILTMEHGSAVGTRLQVEGGTVVSQEEAGCPEGTRITISDLYFNTPARRKFLRSPAAETSQIVDLIGKLGVTRPEVQFRLVSNGRELLMLTHGMTVRERLATIWKLSADDLIDVAGMVDGMTAVGLVARPEKVKSNRTGQIFTVNGRLIKSATLSQAVLEGFSPTVPRGKFPFALINLSLDPAAVDVNVHPQKAEVRFSDRRTPFRAVHRTIASALQEAQVETVHERHLQMALDSEPEPLQVSWDPPEPQTRPSPPPGPPPLRPRSVPRAVPVTSRPASRPSGGGAAVLELYRPGPPMDSTQEATRQTELVFEDRGLEIEVLAQLSQSYIVALVNAELWVIDQHAAHERIQYERLAHLAVVGPDSQGLVVPEVVEFSPVEAAFLQGHLEDFESLGFEVESFGGSAFQLRALPPGLKPQHGASVFRSVVEEAANGEVSSKSSTEEKLREKLRAMVACKSSIRARERLSKPEMKQLILDLIKAESSPYCPHGRPTRVRLDLTALERLFHR